MRKKRNKRKIPHESGIPKFEIPKCYYNNPDALERRARKEDQKKHQEDVEFMKWYKQEVERYGYNFKELMANIPIKNKKRLEKYRKKNK